jgi:hypothetical protein
MLERFALTVCNQMHNDYILMNDHITDISLQEMPESRCVSICICKVLLIFTGIQAMILHEIHNIGLQTFLVDLFGITAVLFPVIAAVCIEVVGILSVPDCTMHELSAFTAEDFSTQQLQRFGIPALVHFILHTLLYS